MIAHEIRTPVTLIIGPLESLKEHWKQVSGKLTDGETITQTLSVIDRNAQRLLLLVMIEKPSFLQMASTCLTAQSTACSSFSRDS